MTSSRYH